MKRITLFLFVSALLFVSCKDNRYFRVEGKVIGGKNHVIYLEQVLPDRVNTIDSFKIKGNERFHFKREYPAYPDFYRVRINDKFVIFAIDSSETVKIHSQDPFFNDYSITGSENTKKIYELNQSVERLKKGIKEYDADVNNDNIAKTLEKINRLIAEHDSLAKSIIHGDTKSIAAYYAIFHKIDGANFYHISNDEGMKLFVAVATAYNAYYPHSKRSKELTSLVLQTKRLKRSEELKQLLLQNNQVPMVMNINLPDADGNIISLSDFRGKVVLVNFAYHNTDYSMDHAFGSRDLYTKYQDKGFEMLGVFFDENIESFKNATKRVPWNRVYAEKSLNSDLLEMYNITQLPTLFLIDQQGNIVSRHTHIDNKLKENLERLLNE